MFEGQLHGPDKCTELQMFTTFVYHLPVVVPIPFYLINPCAALSKRKGQRLNMSEQGLTPTSQVDQTPEALLPLTLVYPESHVVPKAAV